jgi:hypothetical protein
MIEEQVKSVQAVYDHIDKKITYFGNKFLILSHRKLAYSHIHLQIPVPNDLK